MQFTDNAHVFTIDRQTVGRITHVVLDPKTKKVTHIVVRQGIIFKEDKLVPIDLFESSCPEGVILREGIGDLHGLTKFEEERYVPVDITQDVEAAKLAGMVGAVYPYPPSDPVRYAQQTEKRPQPPVHRFVRDTKQNIPLGEIALKEGARVVSADDVHVGNIESVLVDLQTDYVTEFVVSKHVLLAKTRKLVPVSWVESVYEDTVYLNVEAMAVKALPECA